MALKVTPFKFEPFSKKQLKVLTWWLPNSPVYDKDIIIADGAIRSGKTVSMSLSFVQWGMETFDGENLGMSGKTIGSFRRNVLAPLKQMLKSLKYRVKEHRNDNMVEIRYRKKVNYFYIFGGKDERSQDLIQGITLAGMLFDEVALMPESFVNQATARCSVEGAKLWFNCNPAGPYHYFKVNYIDKIVEKNVVYLHFTMDDNLSLSPKVKERYRRMYTGIFYDRYIKGLWKMAEGVIFDMFKEEKHVIKEIPRLTTEWIAVDHGTGNPTAFLHQGFDGKNFYTVREYYYASRETGIQKTTGEYSQDLQFFTSGKRLPVICDPAASALIVQLRKDGFMAREAENDVLPGIEFVANCLNEGKYYIHESCVNLIKETTSYCWDTKAQQRGIDKPLKQNDHAVDSSRYGLYTMRHLKDKPKQTYRDEDIPIAGAM